MNFWRTLFFPLWQQQHQTTAVIVYILKEQILHLITRSSGMDRRTPWVVVLLLMPLCLSAGTKEIVVKTVGRDPGLIPVCGTKPDGSGLIVFVTCTVLTDRHRGEDCRLILLRGVMSAWSGVTIAPIIALSLCAATCIIAAGIFCCDILRKNRHRDSSEHITTESPEANEPPQYSNHDDFYENLQRPTSDIYQNISACRPYIEASADPIHIYDTVEEEADGKDSPIYESF
ncbi:uncharacterized protein V6R79_023217 [Siganus canaliculatus]